METIYKIFFGVAYLIFTIVTVLLINEVGNLKTTIILYLAMTTINFSIMYLFNLYQKENQEEKYKKYFKEKTNG